MNTINFPKSNNIYFDQPTKAEDKSYEIEPNQKSKNSKMLLAALGALAAFGVGAVLVANKVKKGKIDSSDLNRGIENIRQFTSITNPELDDVIKYYPFESFGKEGLPLKYPRKDFVSDINKVLDEVPENSRTDFLKKFNLQPGYNDIDGIASIDGVVPKTNADNEMVELIKRFYQNEVVLEDTKAKNVFDSILKEFPEFGMVIGKQQHGTHAYSVDVHTLGLLQKAVQHPNYSKLSDEGKEILKISALIHDFGKKGNTITSGHAAISGEFAEKFLKQVDLPQNTKERIVNQIQNHHWFEKYNKGLMSPDDFAKIFQNPEDRIIATLMAKGDFESINPNFHLCYLDPKKYLTPQEYEKQFSEKTAKLIN